jgi:hypothetical protein
MSEKLVTSRLPPSKYDLLATAEPYTNGFQKDPGQKHIRNAQIPTHLTIVPLWGTSLHFVHPLVNKFRKVDNGKNY